MRRRDAERDAAPARCGLAAMSSGRPGATVRRYYERLPLAGWTWLGGRRRNPPEIDGDRREIFGNLCPARKHGPRSLKIAADGAPEGVSAAAVRLRMANTSRHNYQGAPLGAPSPLIREREETKSSPRAVARECMAVAV